MTRPVYPCETCNNRKCWNYEEHVPSYREFAEKYGCASHSAAEEKRIKTEQLLETIKSTCKDTMECTLRESGKEIADRILYLMRVFGEDKE